MAIRYLGYSKIATVDGVSGSWILKGPPLIVPSGLHNPAIVCCDSHYNPVTLRANDSGGAAFTLAIANGEGGAVVGAAIRVLTGAAILPGAFVPYVVNDIFASGGIVFSLWEGVDQASPWVGTSIAEPDGSLDTSHRVTAMYTQTITSQPAGTVGVAAVGPMPRDRFYSFNPATTMIGYATDPFYRLGVMAHYRRIVAAGDILFDSGEFERWRGCAIGLRQATGTVAAKLTFVDLNLQRGAAGIDFLKPIVVCVEDANGATVAGYSGNVTLSVASGVGIVGGTATVPVVGGYAIFDSVTVLGGGAHVLRASSGSVIGNTGVVTLDVQSAHTQVVLNY